MKRFYISCLLALVIPSWAIPGFGAPDKKPKWQTEIDQRAKELESLQQQNGTGSERLQKTNFPATFNDLSFTERLNETSKDMKKYKDLKAFRELDVKTASEWCSDSEHKDSVECWDWNCFQNKGGKNYATVGCITYRCAKSEYRTKYEKECKENDYCAVDPTSYKCMKYKCNETDEKDSQACVDWLCKNDPTYRSGNASKCKSPGTACTPTAAHSKSGVYNNSGQCVITKCEGAYSPDSAGTSCIQNSGGGGTGGSSGGVTINVNPGGGTGRVPRGVVYNLY